MKLKCNECGECIDTEKDNLKSKLVRIGNSYKCIKCRGYKFLILDTFIIAAKEETQ